MKTSGTARSVGVFDAKTRLSELLDCVENGECIVITRHGVPIAKLGPYVEPVDAKRVRKGIDGILALHDAFLKKGRGMTMDEIRAAIEAGRR